MKRVRCFGAHSRVARIQPGPLIISWSGIDPVIAAAVQTQKDVHLAHVRFGQRSSKSYTELGPRVAWTVDYGPLHDTEPGGSRGQPQRIQ